MSFGSIAEIGSVTSAAIVSVGGAIVTIKNRQSEAKAVEVQTGIDEVHQAKLSQDLELDQTTSLREDIKLLRTELNETKAESRRIRRRAEFFESFFFNEHLPWDIEASYLMRQHGIQISNPPDWFEYLKFIKQEENI
jgi:uncharacterized small protein (DUF1192 family)